MDIFILTFTVFMLIYEGGMGMIHPDPKAQVLSQENLPSETGRFSEIQRQNSTGGVIQAYETLSCYSRSSTPNIVLILITDVFGLHRHFTYIADQIATQTSFCVTVPDFFQGKAFPKDKFPPRNPQTLTNFIKREGSFKSVVKPQMMVLLEHYDKANNVKFGTFGYCWGGQMAIYSLTDLELGTCISAAAAIHPSPLGLKDARRVGTGQRVLLLPSRNEANLVPFCQQINRRLGPNSCEHKRFRDMTHGFSGAIADWRNIKVKARVDEMVSDVSNFFKMSYTE